MEGGDFHRTSVYPYHNMYCVTLHAANQDPPKYGAPGWIRTTSLGLTKGALCQLELQGLVKIVADAGPNTESQSPRATPITGQGHLRYLLSRDFRTEAARTLSKVR